MASLSPSGSLCTKKAARPHGRAALLYLTNDDRRIRRPSAKNQGCFRICVDAGFWFRTVLVWVRVVKLRVLTVIT